MEREVDLEQFRGYFLSEVAVATAANVAGAVRVTLVASGGVSSVVLVMEDVLHIQMDTSECWDDFFDDFVVLRLPQYGPWPERVHHLLHHHNNCSALTWLRMDGPGPIELLGSRLIVQPRQPAADDV